MTKLPNLFDYMFTLLNPITNNAAISLTHCYLLLTPALPFYHSQNDKTLVWSIYRQGNKRGRWRERGGEREISYPDYQLYMDRKVITTTITFHKKKKKPLCLGLF